MEKKTIIAVILGVLVIISAIQAFQLNGLKEKISEGQLKVSSSGGKVSTASSGEDKKTTALPSSVKNLPQMVGGC